MVVNNRLGYLFVFLGMSMALYAQRKTEVIRYGDLDQWVVRKITESAIIGKETKTLYCVGPTAVSYTHLGDELVRRADVQG